MLATCIYNTFIKFKFYKRCNKKWWLIIQILFILRLNLICSHLFFIHFGFITKYFRSHNKENGNKNIEDSFEIYIYIRPVINTVCIFKITIQKGVLNLKEKWIRIYFQKSGGGDDEEQRSNNLCKNCHWI